MKVLIILLLASSYSYSFSTENISAEMETEFKKYSREKDDDRWESLITIKSFTDGAAGLEYDYWCYYLIDNDPLVFYTKYISGDERAQKLLRHAFKYDFTSFNIMPDKAQTDILPIYLKQLSAIENIDTKKYSNHDKKRHDQFLSLVKFELKEWEQFWLKHQ